MLGSCVVDRTRLEHEMSGSQDSSNRTGMTVRWPVAAVAALLALLGYEPRREERPVERMPSTAIEDAVEAAWQLQRSAG